MRTEALAGTAPEFAMMYWNDHGMSGWGLGLMTVSMVLLWGLIILGIVVLVRHLGRAAPGDPGSRPAPPGPPSPPSSAPPSGPDPEQLLAERLARGEIEVDEYRARMDALRATRGPTAYPPGTSGDPHAHARP
ncbi:SHOCT domain-containing protein [Kitasatospora camelliae]|uniref:Oligomerization/nucleic acid binding protein n=1 Tax=Kitasatospora camelliae TaxID=3156397 RepID=A0AAU8JQ56_9ACTN